ncbi:hypothetical protein HMPREF1556_01303 [Porphyromonas sp. oral taxon 278 str. W7784]|nr:hypothetical protein HMPREF1556_01303 [Porphyromonas sp. oral taxon 278 str. W7784]
MLDPFPPLLFIHLLPHSPHPEEGRLSYARTKHIEPIPTQSVVKMRAKCVNL